jgi:mono/diheme cytochrome c family protein
MTEMPRLTLLIGLAAVLGSQAHCNLSSRRDGIAGAANGTSSGKGKEEEPVARSVPISGGTLFVNAEGRAWVSDPDRDRVVIADVAEGRVVEVHELGEAAWPGKAAEDPEGNVYLVLRGSGEVQRFDPQGGALERFEVCRNPRGVAWSPAREALLVACAEGDLVVSTPTGKVVERSLVAPDLRDVVVTPSGEVWTSTFRSAELLRLNGELEVAERLALPSSSDAVGNLLVARVVWELAVGVDGELVALHQRMTTRELPVSAPDVPAVAPAYGGAAVESLPVVGSVVTTVGDTVSDQPLDSAEVLSVDTDVDPLSGDVVVVSAGTETVSRRSGGVLTAEHRPSAQPIAAAFFAGDVVIQTREPAELITWSKFGEVSRIELGGDEVEEESHEIFHGAVRDGNVTGISCASCHPEGRDDGHTWSFEGIGARRTQSLLGNVAQSKPFHWDGDMTSLGELMDVVFSERMGNRKLTASELRGFEDWLAGLGALRPAKAKEADVTAGRAAFERAGCDGCHSGERFSDEGNHDVGTGKSFQTPSLLGLRFRGPFMHDGCAPHVEDRFDPACGGDAHGKVSSLDSDERASLVRFLESL